MKKPQIVRDAERVARMCFLGIAIPMRVEIPDDKVVEDENAFYVYSVDGQKRYLITEKVLKFNRSALRNIGKVKTEKSDPRYNGGEDTMILPVGKPGSRERVEALRSQYEAVMANNQEVSPFSFEE